MSEMIFQPQGTGTLHTDGNITVKPPGIEYWYSDNFKLAEYPNAVTGYSTGLFNVKYSGRFDDPRYYAGDTPD